MATYAIGDINGDYSALLKLLETIEFQSGQDTLWFTGNLVGEHESALAVLEFVQALGSQAITVLGEQELILLSLAEGFRPAHASHTYENILTAPNSHAILSWLRQWPLFHYDRQHNYALVHAGLPAQWSLSQVSTFSIEAETALGLGDSKAYFEHACDHPPRRWNAKLRGWQRLHFIISAFTRLKSCTDKGYMDFGQPLAPNPPIEAYAPWYTMPGRETRNIKLIFSIKQPDAIVAPNIYPLSHGNFMEDLPGMLKLPGA
jgi:bis(5'-nucleosyl)-tetraphosphatase (symmetrical)